MAQARQGKGLSIFGSKPILQSEIEPCEKQKPELWLNEDLMFGSFKLPWANLSTLQVPISLLVALGC